VLRPVNAREDPDALTICTEEVRLLYARVKNYCHGDEIMAMTVVEESSRLKEVHNSLS